MKDFDFARSVYFHFEAYNAFLLQERVYGSGRKKNVLQICLKKTKRVIDESSENEKGQKRILHQTNVIVDH